jgi:recombination protein RecA
MEVINLDKYKLKDALGSLKKKYGKDSIAVLGKNLNFDIPRLKTNLRDFDYMLGGGLPLGRITEVFGPESAGKTTLAYYLCSLVDLALFIDAEGTFDEERAGLFKIKPGKLVVNRPSYGEEAVDMICEFTEAGVPLIVVDSVPCLFPKKIVANDIGKDAISPIPRLLSQQLFPKLIPLLRRSETIVVFINQIRDNITTFGWGEPYMTPGGKALKHHCSVRIEVRRRSWIGAKDARYGLLNAFRVVKSKVGRPFNSCEIPMLFEYGYTTKDDMKDVLKDLRKKRRAADKEFRELEE